TGSYTLGIGRSGAANYFTSTGWKRSESGCGWMCSEPVGCARSRVDTLQRQCQYSAQSKFCFRRRKVNGNFKIPHHWLQFQKLVI
ncbi:unnamed protein product, partial [Iphiclides podalirius]